MFTVVKKVSIIASLMLASHAADAACPAGTIEYSKSGTRTVCRFEKNEVLNQTVTLTPANDYILIRGEGIDGKIYNGTYIGGDNVDASKLIIQPGVRIYGDENTFLSISRGSTIHAEGTKKDPIVFTASKPDQVRGLWGGLIVNGNASVNVPDFDKNPCKGVIFEGVKERNVCYGGTQDRDNSGVLKYVRVEYGGYPIAPNKEVNGFTFNGVGSDTLVDYIQAHMIKDDGIEFFGGTVNVKHVISTGNDDDGVDWDFGWRGKAQFVLIQQADDIADNGFESDSNAVVPDSAPRSSPTLSNVTMIGGKTSGYGMLLRKGTSGTIMNSIVTGFAKACLDIDDKETFSHLGLVITNTVFNCAKTYEEEAGDPWSLKTWIEGQAGNLTMDPQLQGHLLKSGSPLLKAGEAPSDLFFDMADFIGAVGSAKSDWTAGWSVKL